MKFKLVITPAINLKIRHKISELLEEYGYSIIGQGQFIDGCSSDISFERDDPRDKGE